MLLWIHIMYQIKFPSISVCIAHTVELNKIAIKLTSNFITSFSIHRTQRVLACWVLQLQPEDVDRLLCLMNLLSSTPRPKLSRRMTRIRYQLRKWHRLVKEAYGKWVKQLRILCIFKSNSSCWWWAAQWLEKFYSWQFFFYISWGTIGREWVVV